MIKATLNHRSFYTNFCQVQVRPATCFYLDALRLLSDQPVQVPKGKSKTVILIKVKQNKELMEEIP